MKHHASSPRHGEGNMGLRRRRATRAAAMLAAVSLSAAMPSAMAGTVGLTLFQDGGLTSLLAPSGSSKPVRFRAIGDGPSFTLRRDGREAMITFDCPSDAKECGKPHPLEGTRGSGGDLLFRANSGEQVLRITSAGGATLFGGAPFVPSSVPRSGIAVVRN